MNHLTEREMSAHQDHALSRSDRARVDAHLATCMACQLALEGLNERDRSLAALLEHDPGQAYFETFAGRVEQRIRAEGSKPPPEPRPWLEELVHWVRTPVGVSWAGAAGVVIVGAGLVTITVHKITGSLPIRASLEQREAKKSEIARDKFALRGVEIAARTDSTSAAAPPPLATAAAPPLATAAALEAQAGSPSTSADQDAGAGQAANESPATDERAAPGRAVEMKRGPAGEDVPVAARRQRMSPPATAAPRPAPTGGLLAAKQGRAEPAAAEALQKELKAVSTPAAPAPPRRCGTIRDPAGRPLANAQLMVVETGTSAQSRADGSFCLDVAPPGRTLVIMAVGYMPQRLNLDARMDASLAITLQVVSVVGGNLALIGGAPASRWGARKGAALDAAGQPAAPATGGDVFANVSDSVRVQTIKARNLESAAELTHSAPGYDLAAMQWEHALRRLDGGPLEIETRYRIASARYRAWKTERTHERSVAALESISSFVLRAPAGPEMEQATRWLGELHWSETKATFR